MLPGRPALVERIPERWAATFSRFVPHLLGLVVLAFALGTLLPDLTEEPLHHWDGSRYANTAQAMREHGRYLFTVNDKGQYALQGLSKPPLLQWGMIASIWLFGQGVFALRFTTALATALTALTAYWYCERTAPGSRAHRIIGVLAAVASMVVGGIKYSQILCIEPVLMFWTALTLFLYAEAMARTGVRAATFATLAGVAIAGAFLTKQLACGTVVFAIVLTEMLVSFRDVKNAFVRLVAAALPSMTIPGAWTYLTYRAVGDRLYGFFFKMSIQQRMVEGFGKQHRRWLNRMEHLVDVTLGPFPWELAFVAIGVLLGIGLLSLRRRRIATVSAFLPDPARRAFLVLPAAYTLCWTLVYANASKTLLEWYAVGLTFPGVLGLAYLVGAPAIASPSDAGDAHPWLRTGAWVGAVAVLVLAASQFGEDRFARLNLVALIMVAMGVLVLANHQIAVAWRLLRRWVPAVSVLALAGIAAMRLTHPTLDPDPFHVFANAIDAEGIDKVWISKGYPDGFQPDYLASAHFAPGTVQRGKAPWARKGKRKLKAAIIEGAFPVELDPGPGVRVIRGAGSYLLLGELRQHPAGAKRLAKALEKGPVTIESEHLSSHLHGTVIRDARASNGLARAYEPWGTFPRGVKNWFVGGKLHLPKGNYVARFFVALQCDRSEPPRGALAVVRGRSSLGRRKIRCRDRTPDGYATHDVPFRLSKGTTVDIKVTGRGIRHDRTEIWSWSVLNERKGKKHKKRS